MTFTDELGDLVYVDPKGYFKDEAKFFTPWVSSGGLGKLSKALKTELELVETEQSVGTLKADIACKDPSGDTVVIENQLTESDNKHLGQLTAYTAGMGATTAVWIAPSFKPIHRKAIRLLNRVDNPRVRFFCVEIRLWQVGNSTIAPQFVVIAHPDDWEKRPNPPPPRGNFYQDYWASLKEHLDRSGSTVPLNKPGPKALIFAPFGKAGFALKSSISVMKNQTKVDLLINGVAAEPFGQLLHSQKAEIEEDLGEDVKLDWKIPPDWSIATISTADTGWTLRDVSQWEDQFRWFEVRLNEFNRVFRDRVDAIDPTDYTPYESDEELEEDEEDSQDFPTHDEVQ